MGEGSSREELRGKDALQKEASGRDLGGKCTYVQRLSRKVSFVTKA